MLRAALSATLVALLLVIASCDERIAATPATGDDVPTWSRDVAPLVAKRCASCHAPGELAPFSLLTYENARPRAGLMASAVRDRRMPPWGARESETCAPPHPFRDDPRLTEHEIDLVARWAAAGAPEGAPASPVARVDAPSTIPAGDRVELAPRAPMTLTDDRDRFVCVVLDPGVSESVWITGLEIVPGDRSVVHHVVALADPDGTLSGRADAEGRFECPGVPIGSAATSVLAVWLPGSGAVAFPEGAALPIAGGSRIVLQMHYAATGRIGARDATRVVLQTTRQAPRYLVYNGAWGNSDGAAPGGDGLQPGPADPPEGPRFSIPAGARDHVETMRFTMPSPPPGVGSPEALLLGLLPHAHFAAVRVTAELERGGARTCLVDDAWDAHWQRLYVYDAPLESLPQLLPGDRVTVRCRYDNSLENFRLAQALAERRLPLADIGYGERTTQEMCAVFVQLVFALPR